MTALRKDSISSSVDLAIHPRRHTIKSLKPTYLIAGSVAALIALGPAPTAASAAAAPGGSGAVPAAAAETTTYRQLIGEVSRPIYFEASVPDCGRYFVEYEVAGLAFFGTYVDGTELGYVGGPDGVYRTRALQLSAGGHLIQAVGPHGSGKALVYLVKIA